MTIKTDKVVVENGADYTFVCRKIPFAISCSSDFPHGDVNLIDLDLANKMKIPLRNIRVTRMSILGHDMRAVGRIKQTVQCVHQGRVQGNVHLEAKVVRDLFSVLNVDCLASARTYERLVGRKPPDPEDEGYNTNEEIPNLDDVEEAKEGDEEENEDNATESINNNLNGEEEKEPPDPNNKSSLMKVEDEYTKYGFKDFEDALENAPWSHQCIPRECDTWRDDIAAADKGYPDTRYDYVTLAMLRQGLANLESTGKQQITAQDKNKHAARNTHHRPQPRGPLRRKEYEIEDEDDGDEYTADELAVMHGYPVGPRGLAGRRRM